MPDLCRITSASQIPDPFRVESAIFCPSARFTEDSFLFSTAAKPFYARMRYYEQRYPEVDELVMVQVRQIAEMGAYVKLLEYDNIDGMILLSELSRRRIRSIQKLIRIGRNEVVVVGFGVCRLGGRKLELSFENHLES